MPGTDGAKRANDRFTRRFVIGFAVVEAILITWALLSGGLNAQ